MPGPSCIKQDQAMDQIEVELILDLIHFPSHKTGSKLKGLAQVKIIKNL